MKTLLVIIMTLLSTTALAEVSRSQWETITNGCMDRYTVRDRFKTTVLAGPYSECVEEGLRNILVTQLLESEIELNRQKSKWLEDDRRYYRRVYHEN